MVKRNYDFYSQYQPLGGVGRPQDIAEACFFLASPAAQFMTGSILDVDGGYAVNGLPLYSEEV